MSAPLGKRITNYIKESIVELKKVTWPTKKDTSKYTVLVIGISLFTAVFLGGLDFLFNWVVEIALNIFQ